MAPIQCAAMFEVAKRPHMSRSGTKIGSLMLTPAWGFEFALRGFEAPWH